MDNYYVRFCLFLLTSFFLMEISKWAHNLRKTGLWRQRHLIVKRWKREGAYKAHLRDNKSINSTFSSEITAENLHWTSYRNKSTNGSLLYSIVYTINQNGFLKCTIGYVWDKMRGTYKSLKQWVEHQFFRRAKK